ncbi:MAG TPA: MFS transporter [Rhizomicrobium sp.]
MSNSGFMFEARRSTFIFFAGCVLVTLGVLLHLPMYWMAKDMGFVLSGMPMDPKMYVGMALIVLGIIAAAYGLLPRMQVTEFDDAEILVPPEDAPLTRAHWLLMTGLAIGLIIDIMKPATLGFVTPGMLVEYHITRAQVAALPLSALTGLTLGSFVWGWLADRYGRRAAILLSAVIFIGTSICGAMPSLNWNIFMCFLMGLGAGGMLPVAYALLAENMPTRHRGWCLVLIGGIGAVGGYLVASELSALLQPVYGWRIMWFLNLPTGLMLIALGPLLPESARFLMYMGRIDEAKAVLARFGAVEVAKDTRVEKASHAMLPPVEHDYITSTIALTLAALAWGFVNFGLLLWLPSTLVAEGQSVGLASTIIARSTLFAAPLVVLSVFLYAWWSTKWSLVSAIAVTALGLLVMVMREEGFTLVQNPLVPITLLIIGASGIIAILLPYTAENYPIRIRGRAIGWIAGCTKGGGLIAQGAGALALVPAIGNVALIIAVPAMLALVMVGKFGRETRMRDLRELEHAALQKP